MIVIHSLAWFRSMVWHLWFPWRQWKHIYGYPGLTKKAASLKEMDIGWEEGLPIVNDIRPKGILENPEWIKERRAQVTHLRPLQVLWLCSP